MLNRFSGDYDCKVDAKGRLALPAGVRKDLPEEYGNKVVVKRGFEECLTLYAYDEWRRISDRIARLDEFNPEERALQRIFFRGSHELEFDKAGRINLPKSLLRAAKIESDVLMASLGNRIEIWNPEVYEAWMEENLASYKDLASSHSKEVKDAGRLIKLQGGEMGAGYAK